MSLSGLVKKLDEVQQRNKVFGFTIAVVKKYGEDEAGRQAALLTYYSFLSLFPLLLVLTTVTERVLGHDPHMANTVIKGITNYFPLLGSQLSAHVHGLHRSGLALVFGILLTLYGSRGVADVFRSGLCKLWGVKPRLVPFPKTIFKSLTLIIVGGLGFILASISAGLAADAGHGLAFRLLSILINLVILFWLFTFLINFSLPSYIGVKDILPGAAASAIGLVILQYFGTYLLQRQLKNMDALYSYFAVALSLLFWLYLQAQVLYYSIEIAVVSSKKLWPKSLT